MTIISVLLVLSVTTGVAIAQTNPPTLSACQISEVISTNWIAIPGALHIEPDTNGVQTQFAVERETISTNVILKATYAGKDYSYILESYQRSSPPNKRMVPIVAVQPPAPPPLPVSVSSNAVYYRELKP